MSVLLLDVHGSIMPLCTRIALKSERGVLFMHVFIAEPAVQCPFPAFCEKSPQGWWSENSTGVRPVKSGQSSLPFLILQLLGFPSVPISASFIPNTQAQKDRYFERSKNNNQ